MMIPDNISDAMDMYPNSVAYCEKWKQMPFADRVQHMLEQSEVYQQLLLHEDIIKSVDLYRAQYEANK